MSGLRKVLTGLLNILAGGSFLVMVALTCWQVFTRYVLGSPSYWSEELVSYMFAWMSLLGGLHCYFRAGTYEHTDFSRARESCCPKAAALPGRSDSISFFGSYFDIWGHPDYKPGYGTDDVFTRCSNRHFLYCPAVMRTVEYGLHGAEHY